MTAWTGEAGSQPASFWPVFIGFAATILGILPAVLLLRHKPQSRLLGKLYLIFLIIATVVITWIITPSLFLTGVYWSGLCLWAFFTLQSRRFREAFDGGKQK